MPMLLPAAPRPAWGLSAWPVCDACEAVCRACAGPGPLAVCPGCAAAVCGLRCARAVHGGLSTCAWFDRPAYPSEPSSLDGTPWPCDGCGGELPPAAYDPVATRPDGMTWHACSAACRVVVTDAHVRAYLATPDGARFLARRVRVGARAAVRAGR